jgi:heat shock protein HslJ
MLSALPSWCRRAMLCAGMLAATLAGSATAQSPAASVTEATAGLDGTNWALTSIAVEGTMASGVRGGGATLEFVGDQAGGSAGCDQFLATYAVDAAMLTFGPVLTTRMACDEETLASATSFLTLLATVASFSETAGNLTLMDATGTPVLTFASAPMPSLEGSWRVTGFHDGSATVTPSADSILTVAFQPSGRVQGDGGCNTFGGPFGVSGAEISVGPLMSTMRSCGDALDAQEQRYMTALQQAFTWSIDSGTLELRDYDGIPQVTAEHASSR